MRTKDPGIGPATDERKEKDPWARAEERCRTSVCSRVVIVKSMQPTVGLAGLGMVVLADCVVVDGR